MDTSDNHKARRTDHAAPPGPLGALHLAAVFLTRMPLPRAGAVEHDRLAAATWAFPIVGAFVGLAGGGVYVVATLVGLPVAVAAILALATMALATGALHEDGLADTADGFGGGADRAAKLAIMRDSRIGAFGALALIFVVAGKIFALTAIGATAGTVGAVAAIVAAAAFSRAAMSVVMVTLAPARDSGLGADAGRPATAVVVAALLLGAVIAAAVHLRLGPAAVIVALAAGLAASWAVAVLARRQIGGYTGDVLGAAQQASETTILLALSAVLARVAV